MKVLALLSFCGLFAISEYEVPDISKYVVNHVQVLQVLVTPIIHH